jgi:predicted TPR repeat methyltransferase
MMSDPKDTAISGAYGASTPQELTKQYDTWADTYDGEVAALGYCLPWLVVAMFTRHIPLTDQPILDAGCGTGILGDALNTFAYANITGIDLSKPMLDQAAKLGVYNQLSQMTLGETLDIPDNMFSGIISAGVFTQGHAPHSSFDELIRITKSGGHIVFSVRQSVYENDGFREKQQDLQDAEKWRLTEATPPCRPFTIGYQDVMVRIFAYQVL